MLASPIFNKWNMHAVVYIDYEASSLPTLHKVYNSSDSEMKFTQGDWICIASVKTVLYLQL
jgi:hypothetical protein